MHPVTQETIQIIDKYKDIEFILLGKDVKEFYDYLFLLLKATPREKRYYREQGYDSDEETGEVLHSSLQPPSISANNNKSKIKSKLNPEAPVFVPSTVPLSAQPSAQPSAIIFSPTVKAVASVGPGVKAPTSTAAPVASDKSAEEENTKPKGFRLF